MKLNLLPVVATPAPLANAREARERDEELSQDPGLGPGLQKDNAVRDVTSRAVPTDRNSSFVAVTGSESEQSNATTLVVVAYGLFWVITFALIWKTYRGQERLRERLADIERRLPKDMKDS